MKTSFLSILIASSFLINSCHTHSKKKPPNTPKKRPNVVIIYADDLGYGDPSCYGGTLIPTPNIDRIAKRGIKFTEGYVTCPVCGPSRYGLLSGAYQQRFGVQWNPDTWSKDPNAQPILPQGHLTLNQTLSAAGYTSGIVGKWNLEGFPKTTFDESKSVMNFGGNYFPNEDGTYEGVNKRKTRSLKEIIWGPKREGDEYLTDRLGRQSVEFIENHKNDAQPFFLYLAFNAPHSPLQAKKSMKAKVAHIKTEAYQLYAAMTISMDENVGKVLDALERNQLTQNTLIIFASDNGPTYSYRVEWPKKWPKELLGSAGPLSGHKGQMKEGGIRVPYLVSWPSKLPQGVTYNKPVSTLDIYPTVCKLAKASVPQTTQLDGVDLWPYLTGKNTNRPHEKLFWYADYEGAIRKGDWKLYVNNDENVKNLYHLKNDISESTDLINEQPEIAEALLKDYQNFVAQMPPKHNPKIKPNH